MRGRIAIAVSVLAAACGGESLFAPGDAGHSALDGAAKSPSDGGLARDASLPDGALLDGALPDGSLPDGSLPDSSSGVSCKLNSDCSSVPDTFCEKDSCDPTVEGTCALIPGTRETGYCTLGDGFVCGCDGQTYAYACLAHAESVNVASQGPCPLAQGGTTCMSNADCASSALYCKRAHCTDTTGTCAGEPDFQVCFAAEDGGQTACGCDHQTYGSACEAASHGLNVDFEGKCPPLPSGPCTSQADCGDAGYATLVYCQPTQCGEAAGTCTAIPIGCPGIYIPVCGCDGGLYPNSCFAEQARDGFYASDAGCPP